MYIINVCFFLLHCIAHILLVYIFTRMHTFGCIYIYVYTYIHYIEKFYAFSEILDLFNAYYVYINILTHN